MLAYLVAPLVLVALVLAPLAYDEESTRRRARRAGAPLLAPASCGHVLACTCAREGCEAPRRDTRLPLVPPAPVLSEGEALVREVSAYLMRH